jgi:hypothetical protein
LFYKEVDLESAGLYSMTGEPSSSDTIQNLDALTQAFF